MLTKLHSLLTYSIGGAPLWLPTAIVLLAVTSQAVKVAKWTKAERLVQLVALGILKSPFVGAYIAMIPLLGDILHYIANDSENLPPTLVMRIRGKVPPKAPPAPPSTTVAVLIFSMLLNGCGFGTCILGKLKSSYQTVVEEAAVALVSADYTALLAQLATEAGADVVSCSVQAIVAYEQSKQHKPADGAHLKAMPNAVLDHGRVWLSMQKPTACVPRRAS